MDHRLVSRSFPVLLFLLLAACAPAPVVVPTPTATRILLPTLSVLPTISAMPTSTFLAPAKETLTPLPTSILPPPPGGELHWPVEDAQGLKQQIKEASVIIVRMQNFLYCPPNYDDKAKIDLKICTDLEFELGEQQRQQLIDAIDDETQAGQLPEELQGGGSPIVALPYPEFNVSLILPHFRFELGWATERSFVVYQAYYPNRPQNIWDLPGQLRQGDEADVGFVQETPLLYQAVKGMLPDIVFPPEYPASLLAYERVIVEYDGKKCEYGNGDFPSLRNFIYGLLDASTPVNEPRPAGQPRAIFTFWVRGQAYPLEVWQNERFAYQGTIYKYITRTSVMYASPYVGSMQSANLEDLLWSLNGFTECKAPQ
jgi:hypothetical protein